MANTRVFSRGRPPRGVDESMYHYSSLQTMDHPTVYTCFIITISCRPAAAQGKQGKQRMAKKNPCQGKHREFGNFVKTQGKHREFCLNTGNFVSLSCKCSDSKSKGYCDSCRKKIHYFQQLDMSAKSVLCM